MECHKNGEEYPQVMLRVDSSIKNWTVMDCSDCGRPGFGFAGDAVARRPPSSQFTILMRPQVPT